MSSKTKHTAKTEDSAATLVPQLRFPEFRNSAGWKGTTLGDEGTLLSSLTGKSGPDFDTGDARFVTYMNVFANTFVDPNSLRHVDVKVNESQNAVARGDVFFTVSSETPEDVGMSSVLLHDLDNCYLNSFCTLFRFRDPQRANCVFTGYLLRQPFVRGYFTQKAQGSTRYNLSKDAFRSLPLYLPSLAEQQKIADCLSSLDELIAAQARKVEALKKHKKGLMQQLFPRDGETQPRWRFPEFQDAGDWVQTSLGKISVVLKGKGISKADLVANGSQPCIRYGELYTRYGETIKEAVSKTNVPAAELTLSEPNDVIIPASGETKIDIAKASCVLAGGIALGGDLNVIRTKLNGVFLSYYLNGPKRADIAMVAQGDTVVHLYPKQLALLVVAIPSPAEQQRIADCLTSLDELITAESQRLDALKTHKRALMQQLFPSPEDHQT